MDNRPKVFVRTIFLKYGKPWEQRIIVDYATVKTTRMRVLEKSWHGKVLNLEFFKSGILVYYA